ASPDGKAANGHASGIDEMVDDLPFRQCEPYEGHGDTAAAIAFLANWYGERWFTLVALDPDDAQPADIRTFDNPWLARGWIEKYQGTRNLYFHVNELRAKNVKATKDDVAAVLSFHVDRDAAGSFAVLSALEPRPGIIVETGSDRCHGYWL